MPDLRRFHIRRHVFLIVALPGWCLGLVALRALRTGHPGFRFLVWNLVLAMVPAVAAVLLVRAERRGAPALERLAWLVTWLLFLPNAPYIVTDFVHLHARPPVPLWFDIALMVSFAGTGLLLCYGSLADVQGVVARRAGTAAGWAMACGALLLSGLGIYMGRFLRWNSWDTILRPRELFSHAADRVADPTGHSRGLLVTLVYGIGLMLGYAAVRIVTPRHGPRRPPGPPR